MFASSNFLLGGNMQSLSYGQNNALLGTSISDTCLISSNLHLFKNQGNDYSTLSERALVLTLQLKLGLRQPLKYLFDTFNAHASQIQDALPQRTA